MTSDVKEYRPVRRAVFRAPFKVAVGIVMGYLVIEAFAWLGVRLNGDTVTAQRIIRESAGQLELVGLTVILVLYGVFHGAKYHPLRDPGYSAWLATTPWSVMVPLPLDPKKLVWEDLFPIGFAAGVVFANGGNVLGPIAGFASAYTLMLYFSAAGVTPIAVRYAIGFGWPTVMLLWGSPAAAALMIVMLVVASQIGLRAALAEFPWKIKLGVERRKEEAKRSADDWNLGPQPPVAPIPLLHCVLVPVMLGWWIYCVMMASSVSWMWSGDSSPLVLFVIVEISFGLLRAVRYCSRFASPISLWGRIWNGYWIVSGYDYVFLASIIAPMGGGVALVLMWMLGASPSLGFAFSFAVALACTMGFGPSRRKWQLTGHHRILLKGEVVQASRRKRGKGI
jgi:hypothetical protein